MLFADTGFMQSLHGITHVQNASRTAECTPTSAHILLAFQYLKQILKGFTLTDRAGTFSLIGIYISTGHTASQRLMFTAQLLHT